MNGPTPQTLYIPQSGKTALLTDQQKVQYTANREDDCRTALCRGIAEYLEQLQINAVDGNAYAFKTVFATWAQPEDDADYPSACVHTEDEGIYEDSAGFTPNLSPDHRVGDPSDGRYIVTPNGFQLDMEVEVTAATSQQRKWLVAMIEDALDPVDWRSGVLLTLPHYFGQHAVYKKIGVRYIDDAASAQQNLRLARVRIRGNVPETRLQFSPTMVVRSNVIVGTAALPAGPNLRTP